MDDDALRFRVAQLAAEMQERTKWEALRLMEGVKQAEADVARKVKKNYNFFCFFFLFANLVSPLLVAHRVG